MSDVFTENRERLLEHTKKDNRSYHHLRKSLQYLTALTNANIVTLPGKGTFSMQDVLAEIQTRKAPAKRSDICVHPEYAADAFTILKEDRERGVQAMLQNISDTFQVELLKILQSSPLAIIIDAPSDTKNIGTGKRFTSATTGIPNEETGHLYTPELARLLLETTVSPNTTILFHGAEYGRCPTLTAQQLFLALRLGIVVPLEKASPSDLSIYANTLSKLLPLIHESHFRMGTLLKLDDEGELPEASEKLTLAMHGEQTRIYPYCLSSTSTALK